MVFDSFQELQRKTLRSLTSTRKYASKLSFLEAAFDGCASLIAFWSAFDTPLEPLTTRFLLFVTNCTKEF
jgi:hypothetical protein